MKQYSTKMYCLSLALISESVLAYTNTEDTYITDGGLFVKPSFEIGIVNDDNIYNQESGTSSSLITTMKPAINLKMDDGINTYSIDAEVEKGIYEASSADNYTDGLLAFSAHVEASDRHRFDGSIEGTWVTEPRGTGITEVDSNGTDEPVTYNKNTFASTYEYGALQTKGRLAFDLRYYQKEYRNFNDLTRRSNHDSLLFGSTFYYSTRAHTDAFIEATVETISYDYHDNREMKRDSDVYSAFVGMQWKASSVVHGFAKIGAQAKEFDDGGREDFTGFSWNVGGVWRPLSYSKLRLSTSQATKDPDVFGDYILETKYKVDWKHYWTSYFYSAVEVHKYQEDYSGVNRVDDTLGYELKFNYDFTKNIAVALFGVWDRNTSTSEQYEYDKNIVGVSFTFTI